MKVTIFLRKYKITQKEFAKYIGYSEPGMSLSLRNEKKQKVLYCSALRMVLERKGVNLEALLSTLS